MQGQERVGVPALQPMVRDVVWRGMWPGEEGRLLLISSAIVA